MNSKRITILPLALLLGTSCLFVSKAAGSPASSLNAQDRDRDRGDWETPPGQFNDIQRRGFHDGIEGARKDVENHRRLDVNNRDEYRHPDVPRNMRKAYRDAFRRGYQQAMSHQMGPERHGDDHDRR